MYVEGDALVFSEDEVEIIVNTIYLDFAGDIAGFLPRKGGGENGVDLKRLVIPFNGSKIQGMEIVSPPPGETAGPTGP